MVKIEIDHQDQKAGRPVFMLTLVMGQLPEGINQLNKVLLMMILQVRYFAPLEKAFNGGMHFIQISLRNMFIP